MLMNSSELILSINKRLQESGVIDDITDFLHEHPEYFTKCLNSDKYVISSCNINVAMHCKPSERQNTNAFISIDLGAYDAVGSYLSDHSRSTGSKVVLKRRINGEEVSRYVCD